MFSHCRWRTISTVVGAVLVPALESRRSKLVISEATMRTHDMSGKNASWQAEFLAERTMKASCQRGRLFRKCVAGSETGKMILPQICRVQKGLTRAQRHPTSVTFQASQKLIQKKR